MANSASTIAPPPERQSFYDEIFDENLAPLWESLHQLVPPAPITPVRPVLWDYDRALRPRLMEAGQLITAREAERRVLMLQNPGLNGQAAATRSIYAGVQLVLPGEVAPAHRHTQSAIRFILEGGGYTTVDGEKIQMSPGDFVITPSWTFHDHGNETDAPLVWVDVLDIPLMSSLDTTFAEAANADAQPVVRPPGDSLARYGGNMFPVDWKPKTGSSPIFSYPYARSRETLANLRQYGSPDPCHGYKMRYVNPANGGYAMPTIGAFMQLLPAGFDAAPYRSTDGTVYVVVEGEGETRFADGTRIAWKPRDIFVVPSWALHTHHARSEAVLFSASDRPVHEALGVWREERRAPEDGEG
jgi:gentisate 1,2-dioxygenase